MKILVLLALLYAAPLQACEWSFWRKAHYVSMFADAAITDYAINHKGGFSEAGPLKAVFGDKPSSAELWGSAIVLGIGIDQLACRTSNPKLAYQITTVLSAAKFGLNLRVVF